VLSSEQDEHCASTPLTAPDYIYRSTGRIVPCRVLVDAISDSHDDAVGTGQRHCRTAELNNWIILLSRMAGGGHRLQCSIHRHCVRVTGGTQLVLAQGSNSSHRENVILVHGYQTRIMPGLMPSPQSGCDSEIPYRRRTCLRSVFGPKRLGRQDTTCALSRTNVGTDTDTVPAEIEIVCPTMTDSDCDSDAGTLQRKREE
jgi:hypothetical protein